MFDAIITVKVGPSKKSFHSHKGVLSFYSGYFAAALNGNFAESKCGVVHLPDEDPKIFELLVNWLYTRRLPDPPKSGDLFTTLSELWILADRREIPMLANAVLNAIRDETTRLWKVPTVDLPKIYKDTMESSGLRRLAVHLIASTSGPRIITDENKAKWPVEAVWDVLNFVWKMQKEGAKSLDKKACAEMDMCAFHMHEEGARCPKAGS